MSRKLVVLAVLFLIPLSVCLYSSVRDATNAYHSTQQELEGVTLLQTTGALIKAVQKRRGTSASLIAGNESLRADFEAADADAARLVAQLQAQASTTRTFKAGKQIDAIGAQYAKIVAMGLPRSGAELFEAHTAFVRAISAFTGEVADLSQLALDPEPVTYYLMNTVVFSLPDAAEKAALARGKGTAALSAGSLSDLNRGALSVHGAMLRDELDVVRNDIARVRNALGPGAASDELGALSFDDFDAFRKAISSVAAGNTAPVLDAAAYFAMGTRAVDSLYVIHGDLAAKLHDFLNMRAGKEAQRVALVSLLSVGSVGLALYLFIAFALRTGDDVSEIADCLSRASSGDLRDRFVVSGKDELASIKAGLNTLLIALNDTIVSTKLSAESVLVGSEEIASGNLDLSRRTEEQAASLQETAASMEELTSTVRHTADNARQAGVLSSEASAKASNSGNVITHAVTVMNEIGKSSTEMAAIISVIEGIAFQTNILALNAAVEAARAGEEGKGFAVVAGEVRTLARRTAGAAKDVKQLIERSVERINGGKTLFHQADEAIRSVIVSIGNVDAIVREIGGATAQQGEGIEQVNVAISQIDHMTQQNAALVEQAAAASASLKEQAKRMEGVVATFTVLAV